MNFNLDLPKRTAVVCNDAGAANVIIELLLQTGRTDWRPFMQGPALNIWMEAFPEIRVFDSLSECLNEANVLISGTGWSTDLEHVARKKASHNGIRTIAMIDHWVNYPERFTRENNTVYPDEIWVSDDYAFELAKLNFKNISIIKIPNFYLMRLVDFAQSFLVFQFHL